MSATSNLIFEKFQSLIRIIDIIPQYTICNNKFFVCFTTFLFINISGYSAQTDPPIPRQTDPPKLSA